MKLRFYQTYDENGVYSDEVLQFSIDQGDHWEDVPLVVERVVSWIDKEEDY